MQELYTRYLAGASLRELKDWLENGNHPTVAGGTAWSITAVKGILTNEKYCGDVLLQKTFSTDVISKKIVKNTGQLPKYLIQNHHEGIVTRELFRAVQAELARRPEKRFQTGSDRPFLLHQQICLIRPTGLRRVRQALSPENAEYQGKYLS